MNAAGMRIVPVHVSDEIERGQSIGALFGASGVNAKDGDILVITQKAVSKSEDRIVELGGIRPTELALGIAAEYSKDARVVELVMGEARRIVRMGHGVIITETRDGLICANSGVDESNVGGGMAALLPEDPDASARRIRGEVAESCGANVGVIISDTFGRPFRMGQVDCAIGVAGIAPILDYAGKADGSGRVLQTTAIATADEIAGAAELAMGKLDRCPMALVSGAGIPITDDAPGASALIRPEEEDLFG